MYRGYLRVVDIDAFGDISADVADHVRVPLKARYASPRPGFARRSAHRKSLRRECRAAAPVARAAAGPDVRRPLCEAIRALGLLRFCRPPPPTASPNAATFKTGLLSSRTRSTPRPRCRFSSLHLALRQVQHGRRVASSWARQAVTAGQRLGARPTN